MTTIHGIRSVIQEMEDCPDGWHLEVWSSQEGDGIEVWTSGYLSPRNHTLYSRDCGYRRIDDAMHVLEADGVHVSPTALVRSAVMHVWPEAFRWMNRRFWTWTTRAYPTRMPRRSS